MNQSETRFGGMTHHQNQTQLPHPLRIDFVKSNNFPPKEQRELILINQSEDELSQPMRNIESEKESSPIRKEIYLENKMLRHFERTRVLIENEETKY